MKKLGLTKILFLVVIAGSLTLVGCKGSKEATMTPGGVKVEIPCGDYYSDANFFRGTGIATSPNISLAQSKARMDAVAKLSAGIETTIKAVGDQYSQQITVGDAMEVNEKFEEMTRQVVNQTVNNVGVACNETRFDEETKRYTVYMAVQVGKDEVFSGVADRISKDDKLKLDYDKMKFENIFNEEMEKLERERP